MKKSWPWTLFGIFVLLCMFFLVWKKISAVGEKTTELPKERIEVPQPVQQSPTQSESVQVAPSLPEKQVGRPKPSIEKAKVQQQIPTKADTIPPYVYADPAGGFFGDTVMICLQANEPCSILFKTREMIGWQVFSDSIKFFSNNVLSFYGIDTAGNVSEPKTEVYDTQLGKIRRCPEDMVYAALGSEGFCIDRYEWPNLKTKLPQTMISFYAAQDSCMIHQKRLCTAQEWYVACSGPQGWKFSYGDIYENKACNTQQKNSASSGAFPECRSYGGAMDMSGNVREWTSTRAREDRHFYQVVGGFWESHSSSGCGESQYSFYPQNTHLSVGFRCCKNVPAQKE